MDRTNLLITGGIIGVIVVLLGIGMFIYPNSAADTSTASQFAQGNAVFNSKTPEEKAIFVARLNEVNGFDRIEGTDQYVITVTNISLTSDGKYWIVKLHEKMRGENEDYDDNDGSYDWVVTIDAKTWMSKNNDGYYGEFTVWKSLDELVASYIAGIQTVGANGGSEIRKSTIDSKIWKITNRYYQDDNPEQVQEIYVDVATGKSKNTWDGFNEAAGTNGWLTLKEVDDTINKMGMYHHGSVPFKDALRDLYPE